MKGFKTNIERDTEKNENFRQVLYTSAHSQLVLMSIKPKQDIGEEVHDENDQFIIVRKTKEEAEANDQEFDGKTSEKMKKK